MFFFFNDTATTEIYTLSLHDALPICLVDTFRLAIIALNKQTPKKPDYEGDGYDRKGNMIYDTWVCPNCGEEYEVDYDDYKYCPNCGQRLDWEENHAESC